MALHCNTLCILAITPIFSSKIRERSTYEPRHNQRKSLQSSSQILAFNEMHIFFIEFETFPNLGEYRDDSCFDILFISLFSFHSFSVLHLRIQSVLEPCVPGCCEEELSALVCEFEFAGLS